MAKPVISKRMLTAFVVTTLVGAALHFLYDLLPNPLTALFSPVCESIWEHLKLIYWPYLAAMLIVTGKAGRSSRGSWYLSLLVISLAMLGIGYVYHISLGGDSTFFDISLYVILMAIGFVLPGRLGKASEYTTALFFPVVLLGALIVLFTFLPPDHILFADLSAVNTWYTIPC